MVPKITAILQIHICRRIIPRTKKCCIGIFFPQLKCLHRTFLYEKRVLPKNKYRVTWRILKYPNSFEILLKIAIVRFFWWTAFVAPELYCYRRWPPTYLIKFRYAYSGMQILSITHALTWKPTTLKFTFCVHICTFLRLIFANMVRYDETFCLL